MTVDNPWYEHQPPKPEPQDEWYENPWVFVYITFSLIAILITAGMGLMWHAIAFIFCMLVVTGKIRLIDMHTEFPDDPCPDHYTFPGDPR